MTYRSGRAEGAAGSRPTRSTIGNTRCRHLERTTTMPAYFDTGYTVRTPAWHQMGAVLTDYPDDWPSARKAAGLSWEPEVITPFTFQPLPVDPDPLIRMGWELDLPEGARVVDDGAFVPAPDWRTVTRSDTGFVLGMVGPGWTPVLNATMGEVVEACAEQGVQWEAAGAAKEGRWVWALGRLDEPYYIAGDDSATYPYIVFLNDHSGNGKAKITYTDVRVVCANTYQAASMQGERHGREFAFAHTSGITDRLEEAKQALRGARVESTAWRELAESLAILRVTPAGERDFIGAFIPEPPADVVSDRVRDNIAKARATFTGLYNGPTCAPHKGTALGLVDASVEYLDHLRGYRNVDTYLGRTLLRPEPLKARAVTLAREVAGV